MTDFLVGIATCNEPDDIIEQTIRATIETSSVKPRDVLIIDNGDRGEPGRDELSTITLSFAKGSVIRPGRNLGCAASWNLIHKLCDPTPVIIVNADCAVAPDTFEKMLEARMSVLAYGFGCFLLDHALRERVGAFDEHFYPVYYEDVDYRRRMKISGTPVIEWPIDTAEVISEGRSRAVTGIVHGKPATGGYQGWTGEKQKWFDDCLAQSKAYYLAKWGGTPYEETFEMPFNGKP